MLFRSLDIYYTTQVTWLRSADPTTQPKEPFISKPEDRAVLNQWNEIKVGGVYYRLAESGMQSYSSADLLVASRAITTKRRLQTSLCQTNKIVIGSIPCCTDPNYRTLYGIAHYWWFGYKAVAATACIRKYPPPFGWWWCWSSYTAQVYGFVCPTPSFFSSPTAGNSWIAVANINVSGPTKRNWIHGQHLSKCCPNTFTSFTSTLTWP